MDMTEQLTAFWPIILMVVIFLLSAVAAAEEAAEETAGNAGQPETRC